MRAEPVKRASRLSALKELKYGPWLLLIIFFGVALSLMAGSFTPQAGSASETHIAQVLGRIEGAGRVEVAVYYEEASAASVLMESAGTGRPVGAVVVAEGGGDMLVRLRLTRAVKTLLGLEEEAVEVFPMAGTEGESRP